MSYTERRTKEKDLGLHGIIFGKRALEFDGILTEIPTVAQIQKLEKILSQIRGSSVTIKNIMYDQDGTLGGAKEGISEESKKRINEQKKAGLNVAILTNDPSESKKAQCQKLNIPLWGNPQFPKPHPKAFLIPLEEMKWEPAQTLFIGDTPATDKPLTQSAKEFKKILILKSILIHGWTTPKKSKLNLISLPTEDLHPNRDKEMMGTNFLIYPQPTTLKFYQKPKRHIHRRFINTGLYYFLKKRSKFITTKHLIP